MLLQSLNRLNRDLDRVLCGMNLSEALILIGEGVWLMVVEKLLLRNGLLRIWVKVSLVVEISIIMIVIPLLVLLPLIIAVNIIVILIIERMLLYRHLLLSRNKRLRKSRRRRRGSDFSSWLEDWPIKA